MAASLLALAAAVAVTARLIGRVEVAGASMAPALRHGDRLLVVRVARPRTGDVVAVADPRRPDRTLVKRVAAVLPDGRLDVRGDDPGASTDSRTFGPVGPRRVHGRAVYRYWPEERRGRLPGVPPAR